MKVVDILNRLRNSGIITYTQLQFVLIPLNPMPRRFYMLPKIHNAFSSWTFPDNTPPGRYFDRAKESKNKDTTSK